MSAAPGEGARDEEALAALLPPDGALAHDKKGRPVELPEPLAPLADTHGHLTAFDSLDPAVALARAALAGVRLLVVPIDPVDEMPRLFAGPAACLSWLDAQLARARRLLRACAGRGVAPRVPVGWDAPLPDLLDNVRLVAGVHPYGAARLDDAAMGRLRALLASPRCVGVGEIGLDVGPWCEVPLGVQESALRRQLRLARELSLPVELHLRDEGDGRTTAHDRALAVLGEEGMPEAGCDLHCFTAGPEVMAPFAEMGCHIAFGGAVTFRRSDDVRAAAAACPRELVLSETDCPYMAPVPVRGTECEPALVGLSASCVAAVRADAGADAPEATCRALWENARALFGV